MALAIETWSATGGGRAGFKALGHPRVANDGRRLAEELTRRAPVAVYDPRGLAGEFAALYGLPVDAVSEVYVQRLEDVGALRLGHRAAPVSAAHACSAKLLFVADFDADATVRALPRLLPPGVECLGLDRLRLPEDWLVAPSEYLAPVNFATNFALFSDTDDCHTILTTRCYWGDRPNRRAALWLCLFAADGEPLAEWEEPLPQDGARIDLDSREIRCRFDLPAFEGSLFVHALGVARHDVVKYALDFFDTSHASISTTHDANAWPADLYAGLPAPRPDERVRIWIQNPHPARIPGRGLGLRRPGEGEFVRWPGSIPPFGCRAVDVGEWIPDARWPEQLELDAGRRAVRPRYEVLDRTGGRRIAHMNVERTDLAPAPEIATLTAELGEGFLLPAPILPGGEWESVFLPTPMGTTQQLLPLAVSLRDASGRCVLRVPLGPLPRGHRRAYSASDLLAAAGVALESGYGHFELCYDFDAGAAEHADGWLHALFRYEHRASGRGADTSFGSHLYNAPITWRDEPQSYAGRPPGGSTRLFVRLGGSDADTLVHLIHPVSAGADVELPLSRTRVELFAQDGRAVAARELCIPARGSHLFCYRELFTASEREAAGPRPFAVVRDETCRLFGFAGLVSDAGGVSFDHLFGF